MNLKNFIEKKFFLLKECYRGRSLLRIIQNIYIKDYVKLSGNCLDLGSKNTNPSYYEFIKFEKNTKVTHSDLDSNEDEVIKFDYNKTFPLKDDTYDNILLFNVLEHVYDTSNLLSESRRILKKEGKIYGVIPYMYKYHKDPDDYWRFTHSGLNLILLKSGFKNIKILKQGDGEFKVIIHQISHLLKFKFLIYLSWLTAFFLDFILRKIRNKRDQKDYYLGLYFEATK